MEETNPTVLSDLFPLISFRRSAYLSCLSVAMDPSQCKYPPMKDLTTDNITENVNLINSGCTDARLKYLVSTLVQHVHDYARETRLSMAEWETAIKFLTAVGQKCTSTRQVRLISSHHFSLS